MKFSFTILALTLSLVACGGGGSSEAPAPVKPAATSLVVLGNSITRHPPLASVGWAGDWGMAASAQAKDFAHLTGATLGLPVLAQNAADNERDPSVPMPVLPVDARTVVVIELGDNGMPARYAEILASVKHAQKLACVSTWWIKPDRDAQIKAACEAVGGRYVFIGDIYKGGRLGLFENEAVDTHPGDEAMAEISRRIMAVLKD